MANTRSPTEIHADNLLRAMRDEIARKPGSWRNGFWSVAYPSNADCRSPGSPSQRQYVSELDVSGNIIVRDLDGHELTRGPLGWLWNMPAYAELRSRLEAQAKAGT